MDALCGSDLKVEKADFWRMTARRRLQGCSEFNPC
jgi:hypothetical protein